MRTLIATCAGAVAVAGALTGAALPASAGEATASLAGTCRFSGTESFTAPLTLTGRPTRAVVDAAGRCTGTLVAADGTVRDLAGATAHYTQDASAATGSCLGAGLRGTGTITIDDVSLPFSLAEPQVGAVAVMQLSAARWRATGVAYLTPTPQLASTVLSCLSSGVARIPVSLSLLAVAR